MTPLAETLAETLEAAGWRWDPNLEAWYRVAIDDAGEHAEMECLRTPGMRVRLPVDQFTQPGVGDDIRNTFDAMFAPPDARRFDLDDWYLTPALDEIERAIREGHPVVVYGTPRRLDLA